jgi:multidrug efflux pump subunit AcrA (membrane-fusion protein)
VRALPTVARTAALEKNAASRCERLRRLGNGGAASTEDREQAETDLAVARANFSQAVIDAEATLAAVRHKQAVLDTAMQRLQDTRVVVPTPGGPPTTGVVPAGYRPEAAPAEYVVCQRSVCEGEIVRAMPAMPGAATTLFRLIIDRPLKLQAQVPERHAGEVRVGQAAELEAECCPGERFAGTVARVNPSVDRASRTFLVEIHVPNADRRLRAGSFARAQILTRVDQKARTVPEEALVRFAGVTKVFVVENGQARAVPVTTGVSGTDGGRAWVEVAGDLPADTRVITSGQSQLADGTPTRPRSGLPTARP